MTKSNLNRLTIIAMLGLSVNETKSLIGSRFLFAAVAATFALGGAPTFAASPNQSVTDRDGANVARADQLVSRAIATLPDSGLRWLRDQEAIASYYLETGRCKDALELLSNSEPSQENPERLAKTAHRAGLKNCAVEFSLRWARKAREHGRLDHLAQAGAILRVAGNDAEGLLLVNEAEAGAGGHGSRASYLWSIRVQELQIYEDSDIFGPELERAAREFLAAPPSDDEPIGQPLTGGMLAAFLLAHGEAELGRLVAGSVCAFGRKGTISCGTGGHLDTEVDRLSREIASGTPAEQQNAERMLYRNGAIDRIAPHFHRMVDIKGGDKHAAFRSLVFYSHMLWQKDPAAAEKGAREALALGLKRPDKARGIDASSWRVLHWQLAEIFAGAGDGHSVKEILRRAKPNGKERNPYYAAIASGYARFGNDAAVRRYVKAIADEQAQRGAWWAIAAGTPGVPIAYRMQAAERALAIPYVADPKAHFSYVGPPPGMMNCGEMGGGRMIASEGASAEALIRFAKLGHRRSEGAHGLCAYRRYLLNAVQGTGNDDRARRIALELLGTTDQPCLDMSCDDIRVLQLLLDLRLYDEAERLAMMFRQADRTGPLTMVALGLIRSNQTTTASN